MYDQPRHPVNGLKPWKGVKVKISEPVITCNTQQGDKSSTLLLLLYPIIPKEPAGGSPPLPTARKERESSLLKPSVIQKARTESTSAPNSWGTPLANWLCEASELAAVLLGMRDRNMTSTKRHCAHINLHRVRTSNLRNTMRGDKRHRWHRMNNAVNPNGFPNSTIALFSRNHWRCTIPYHLCGEALSPIEELRTIQVIYIPPGSGGISTPNRAICTHPSFQPPHWLASWWKRQSNPGGLQCPRKDSSHSSIGMNYHLPLIFFFFRVPSYFNQECWCHLRVAPAFEEKKIKGIIF